MNLILSFQVLWFARIINIMHIGAINNCRICRLILKRIFELFITNPVHALLFLHFLTSIVKYRIHPNAKKTPCKIHRNTRENVPCRVKNSKTSPSQRSRNFSQTLKFWIKYHRRIIASLRLTSYPVIHIRNIHINFDNF